MNPSPPLPSPRPFPLLLPLLALCACGSRDEGTQVHLGLDLRPTGQARVQGTAREFLDDRGNHILLSRATVTLGSVELVACPASTAWRWLRALSPLGTAEAHSPGSPLKLGEPHVVGLGSGEEGAVLELGTLRPPPGGYCRAHLVFSPADDDAEGLAQAPDMEGKTLVLEGEWTPAAGGPAQPFHLETADVFNAEVSLEGLTLGPGALEASRTVHLAYDRWLDGVDFSAAADVAGERALRDVADTTTLTP